MDEYLDINEFAQYLHIGRSTAYRLCKDPTLPSIRIGKKILINKEKLQSWLTDRENLTLKI